jgi:LmbE family N-acetylglucosaminyl deacetylase
MTGEAVYLFVSPHLDDAALSCGGYIRQLTSSGNRVVVATLITEDLPANLPLTWLAHRNHQQWGAGDTPFSLRRQEDSRAMESLGAEYVHLGLLDAIYRRTQTGEPLYSKDIVNVPVHEEDHLYFESVVREKLAALLQSFDSRTVRIFCPLALAMHVDHVIIRHATEIVCDPKSIGYYEEFPYATRPNFFSNWQLGPDGSQGWSSKVVNLTESDINARLAAISFYKTQVSFLFPSTLLSLHEIALARLPVIEKLFPLKPNRAAAVHRMESVVRAYVSAVHGERYWFKGIAPS